MKIGVLGIGAYGIALTKVLHKANNKIVMWSKFKEEADMVQTSRENKNVLPGVKIEEEIEITTNLKEAVDKADIIVMAVPMMAIRSVCKELKEYVNSKQIICIVSKGIEKDTKLYPSEVIAEEIPNFDRVCMISGPSFAEELANYAETGITIASKCEDVILTIKEAFTCDNLCFDVTDDILGVQISATIKNIYAILLGILSGLGMSESTKASVLAIVINDSREILEILGGSRKTAYMYAGLGDLLLTTMSNKSRNFTLGVNIGKGMTTDEALEHMSAKTVEGLHSLESICSLLKSKEKHVKSIELMEDIIYNSVSVNNILKKIS